LGKIGKKKALENVRKRLKIFENIRKYSKNDVKRSKIFKHLSSFFRHEDIKTQRRFNPKS